LAKIAGRTEVIDFKYSKKKISYNISGRTTMLESFKQKGVLHPAAQLIIYQHFIGGVEGAFFYFLQETSKERVMKLPAELSGGASELMSAIKERLDEIISGSELRPEHSSQECQYCLFRALCGRPNYYKSLRGNN
jgi:CRISPR/Cas system-associated exonuclease Cas4 (RecB family)